MIDEKTINCTVCPGNCKGDQHYNADKILIKVYND
jgi:hypothetical protein